MKIETRKHTLTLNALNEPIVSQNYTVEAVRPLTVEEMEDIAAITNLISVNNNREKLIAKKTLKAENTESTFVNLIYLVG